MVVSKKERTLMNTAYQNLLSILDEQGVTYLTNDECRTICADFRCIVATYKIVAQVDEEAGLFQIIGYAPIRIPEGSINAISETVARANYGLRVGKFEFDCDQGEIRFQVHQILVEDCLDEMVINRLMSTTLTMLDMYLPAVLSVIYGNELPKDAIRCVEAGRCGDEPNDVTEENV